MKKYYTLLPLLILSILLFQGCGSGSQPEETNQATKPDSAKVAATYTLAIETHTAKEDGCKTDDCTYIEIRIPMLRGGDSTVTRRINTFTENEIREAIKTRLPKPIGNVPIDVMCQSFIQGYALFVHEFPDSDIKWYLTIIGDSSIVGAGYFTTITRHSEFIGGPHPTSFKYLHSFDLKTGNLISFEDRFDMDLVKLEAEKRFRKANNLSADARLDDAGFLFKDGIFILPENMGLTPKGLLLIYNPYEVASYAQGTTEILIPYKTISVAA